MEEGKMLLVRYHRAKFVDFPSLEQLSQQIIISTWYHCDSPCSFLSTWLCLELCLGKNALHL
jgi:hypothetical protein